MRQTSRPLSFRGAVSAGRNSGTRTPIATPISCLKAIDGFSDMLAAPASGTARCGESFLRGRVIVRYVLAWKRLGYPELRANLRRSHCAFPRPIEQALD
jgi:hypothetical protein